MMIYILWYLAIGAMVGSLTNVVIGINVCFNKDFLKQFDEEYAHDAYSITLVIMFIILTISWPIFILMAVFSLLRSLIQFILHRK